MRPGSFTSTQTTQMTQLDERGRSRTYGSRKMSQAEAWMVPGNGQIYVNGVHLSEYFRRMEEREQVVLPFEVSNKLGMFNVWAIVRGGGPSGAFDLLCPCFPLTQLLSRMLSFTFAYYSLSYLHLYLLLLPTTANRIPST